MAKAAAKRHGRKVLGIFTDTAASAFDLKRPGLVSMLKRCEHEPHVDVVLVYSYDRLIRSFEDWDALREALSNLGTKWASAAIETPSTEWFAQPPYKPDDEPTAL
jgi:DNA invertase Pin-like site-specific DNA recombinase